jgi:hypothetical protein
MANIKAGGQIALRFPKQDDLAALVTTESKRVARGCWRRSCFQAEGVSNPSVLQFY